MQGIDVLLWFSRWIHIGSAIVAIGGAVFMRFALLPGMASAVAESEREKLREAVRKRWAPVVHACIALLLLTGGFNFVVLAMPPKIEPMPYHAIFGVKFLSALAIFVIASALAGRSAVFAAIRARSRTWLNALLILAAVVVLLSGLLSQVRSRPSDDTEPTASRSAPHTGP